MRTDPSLLIVEDDRVICDMLGKVIQKKFRDAAIYLAENGRVGLYLYKVHTPEIVITDINMPEMDGIEMAAEIKLIQADARFIVMTAYSDKAYFEKFSEIGFCEYMLKPIVLPTLFAAIERCVVEITAERQ
ncbi:MAG: response regulator [Deltaproteobacteria bacterium]|nr:response regulator [Deltaproteobacteria bacterium]